MRKWLIRIALIVIAVAVSAFLYFRTPDTDPVAMRAKYGGAPSQFVDLGGGLTVHLRDSGPRTAPVVMLIHGSNASLHTWEPWAARLGRKYRIVRFDLPGHGLTGPSPSHQYGAAAFADVVERVRAKLGIETMVLAGNSMGGGVAWHYALMYPKRLRGLILVDAAGQPDPGTRQPPLAFRIARTPVVREFAAMITPRSLIAQSLPDAYYDRHLATDAAIDQYWELLRYPGNRAATLERFATPPDYATDAKLARLTTPTLILWGADDRLIPASSAKWLHDRIPGSQLIVYPKTGHVPMEERADQSAADVYRFIETKALARTG